MKYPTLRPSGCRATIVAHSPIQPSAAGTERLPGSASVWVMMTDFLPDPFLWFSHHQWGALLSGFLGAILSGLIAVGVLIWTLKTQQKQFRAQLTAQSAALDAQLKAQSDALEKQLAAQAAGIRMQAEQQAAEASKERELAARAELIVSVQELINSGDIKAQIDVCTRISNGLEKWRFELQGEADRPLWQELEHWRSVFASLVLRRYPTGEQIMLPVTGTDLLLRGAGSLLMHSLVEFRRNFDGKNWTAAEAARVLRAFRDTSLNAPE